MTLSVESTTGMNKTISWLRDPQFKTDIQIQGTQMDNVYRTLRRVKSGISGTQHLVLGSILGEYEGTLTSKDSPRTAPYFLRILPDAFHSDRMIGLMAPMNDDTSLPPLEFSYGYFDEQASEVNLIGPFDQLRRTKETTGESFKLGLLAFEDEAGDIKLVGASAFSNAFGLYDFTFTKK